MHYNFSFDKNRIRLLFMSLTSLMTLIFFLGWIVGGMMSVPGDFRQPPIVSREEKSLASAIFYTPSAIAKTYPETSLPIEPAKPEIIIQQKRKKALESQTEKRHSKRRLAQSAYQKSRKTEKEKVLLHLAETEPGNWVFEQSVDKACSSEVFYSILLGSFEKKDGIAELLSGLKIKAVKNDELPKQDIVNELAKRKEGNKVYAHKASSKYETSGKKETWHNILIGKYKNENEAFRHLSQFKEEDPEMMMATVTSISKLSYFSVLAGAFLEKKKAEEMAGKLRESDIEVKERKTLLDELSDELKNGGEEADKDVENWFVHIYDSKMELNAAQKIVSELEKGKAYIISENNLAETCKQEYRIKTTLEAIKALQIRPEPPKPLLFYTIQLASYYSEKKADEGLEKLKREGLSSVYLAKTSKGRWIAYMGQYETRKAAERVRKRDRRKINKGIYPRSDAFTTKTPDPDRIKDFTGGGKTSHKFQRSERLEYFSNFIKKTDWKIIYSS